MMSSRRSFIRGAAVLLAAPAIVKASSLMKLSRIGDGVSLMSTAHPDGPYYAGPLVPPFDYANYAAAELNEETLLRAIAEIRKFAESSHTKIFARPTWIMSPAHYRMEIENGWG